MHQILYFTMLLLDCLQLEMIGYCHSIAFLFLLYCYSYLLTLDCYLSSSLHFSQVAYQVTRAMRSSIQHRFSAVLEPTAHNFNPLPTAACFLDPSVGNLLILTAHIRLLLVLDAVNLYNGKSS